MDGAASVMLGGHDSITDRADEPMLGASEVCTHRVAVGITANGQHVGIIYRDERSEKRFFFHHLINQELQHHFLGEDVGTSHTPGQCPAA